MTNINTCKNAQIKNVVAGYKSAVLAHDDAKLGRTHRSERSKSLIYMAIDFGDMESAISGGSNMLRIPLRFETQMKTLFCLSCFRIVT